MTRIPREVREKIAELTYERAWQMVRDNPRLVGMVLDAAGALGEQTAVFRAVGVLRMVEQGCNCPVDPDTIRVCHEPGCPWVVEHEIRRQRARRGAVVRSIRMPERDLWGCICRPDVRLGVDDDGSEAYHVLHKDFCHCAKRGAAE
jgi:hypothetical protein